MKTKKIILNGLMLVGFTILALLLFYSFKYMQATSRMKELSVKLEKKIAVWEKKEYKRPVLFGQPIKENAARFYDEAETKMEDPSNLISDLWDAINNHAGPLTGTVLAYYQRNKPALEIFRKGINCETYQSTVNIRQGFAAKLPNFSKVSTLAQLMVIEGRDLEKTGRTAEAIKLYCGLIRMGEDYVAGSSALISTMIGINVADIGREEIHRLLIDDKLSQSEIGELLGYLKTLSDNEPLFANVWEGEGLGTEATCEKLSEQIGFIPTKTNWGGIILSRTDVVEGWEAGIIFYDLIRKGNLSDDEKKMLASLYKGEGPYLSRIFVPNVISAEASYLKLLAHCRGLYILSALKLYQLKHGTYPENLAALAPEIILAVPLDPFGKNQFVYKLDQNKNAILYSIGQDLQDNGGESKAWADLVISPRSK